ncbi:hypothetical protein [Nocardia terpenica]|uniref:hypothetical protein n=1 Tax=Nocardia terpenica TaxID=455432 RepID=UPI0012FD0856
MDDGAICLHLGQSFAQVVGAAEQMVAGLAGLDLAEEEHPEQTLVVLRATDRDIDEPVPQFGAARLGDPVFLATARALGDHLDEASAVSLSSSV